MTTLPADLTDDATSAETPKPGRVDVVSAVMALVASIAIASFLWMRFGPAAPAEARGVGSALPTLHLLDPETSEPLLLLGLRGKVVWVSFWSSSSSNARADLAELDHLWTTLKTRKRFTMAAVSVDADRAGAAAVRAVVAESRASLPVYLAAAETQAHFGVDASRLPLHLLIDETGCIAATAQGRAPSTLKRLADQAVEQLDGLELMGKMRFARQPRLPYDSSCFLIAAAAFRGDGAFTTAALTATRRAPLQSHPLAWIH